MPSCTLPGSRPVLLPLFGDERTTPKSLVEIREFIANAKKHLVKDDGVEFLECSPPAEESSELSIFLRNPPNSTLAASKRRVEAVEAFLNKAIADSERLWMISEIGVRLDPSVLYTRHAGPPDATIRLRLGPKRSRSARDYAVFLREQFEKNPAFAGMTARFHAGPLAFSGIGTEGLADFSIRVRGPGIDPKTRDATVKRVQQRLTGVAGLANIQRWQVPKISKILVELDRAKAAALGIEAAAVYDQIAVATGASSRRLGPAIDGISGHPRPVYLRFPPSPRNKFMEDLRNLSISSPISRQTIPLRNFAAFGKLDELIEVEGLGGLGGAFEEILVDASDKKAIDEAARIVKEAKAEAPDQLFIELKAGPRQR